MTLRVKNLLETRALHQDLERLNAELEERVRERTREVEEAYSRERSLTQRLRELDRMKDDFLMAVSHEVRTPLSAIIGGALTLRDIWQDLDAVEIEQLTGIVVVGCENLERLLAGVLDVDRLRRGLRDPLREATDVGAVIRNVLQATNARGHPIDLRVRTVEANVDPAQFERVVENLLLNAIQHTPPETAITLSVDEHDGGLLLAVDDAGPGVPDHLKETLFDPFMQGEAHPSTPGLGLGLVVVAQFVGLHGGRAWIEDRPGGGAAFRVWFGPPNESEGLEA